MEKLDHRSRVTRMLIRRAFTDLLGQKPIESISVKELCAAAGINRGTFYGHYQDLYDLRRQMEEEMMADFQKAMEPLLAQEGELSPLEVTTGIFRCLRDNADVCTVTLGLAATRSLPPGLSVWAGNGACPAMPGTLPGLPGGRWSFTTPLSAPDVSACWSGGWQRA